MANSLNWSLVRLGEFNQKYNLRVGQTKIGRHKEADIITISDICSRTHCIIQLTDDNNVTIEDKSSNGVFVNNEKLLSTILKPDDVIALGCTEDIFRLATENRAKYYVFKLVATPISAIDISDDEDESTPSIVGANNNNQNNDAVDLMVNNIEPHNENDEIINDVVNGERSNDEHPHGERSNDERSNGEPSNGERSNDEHSNGERSNEEHPNDEHSNDEHLNGEPNHMIEQPITDVVDNNASDGDLNESDAGENDESVEEQYSQQCVREIKQEVSNNCSFEAHDNDFIICDDSDNDGDDNIRVDVNVDDNNEDNKEDDNEDEISLSQWCSKLSQNQDFDKRSVVPNDSKKRKGVQVIDALPERTKRRRKSASSEMPPIKRSEKDRTTANEIVVDMRNDPQTDNNSAVASTSTWEPPRQSIAVEVLVSTTTEPRKKDEPSATISFEDALKSADTIKRHPRRIAHVPKDHNASHKSILRLNGERGPSKKKVGFKVIEREVRFFEQKDYEDQEIIVNPHVIRYPAPVRLDDARRRFSFEIDSLDRLINEITEWDPAWLALNSGPPINGPDFKPDPLMDDYPNIDLYHKIIIPLLKLELWSSIQSEEIPRKPFEVTINSINKLPKSDGHRHLIFAQMSADAAYGKLNVGAFVIVAMDKQTFFAYISQSRYCQSGYARLVSFTMEVSQQNVRLDVNHSTQCSVTPITNIRTELKLFNAVLLLNTSPLKDLILYPRRYRPPEIPARKLVYNGYGQLNEEQAYVVETVYNKCLHSSTNLTLIEGPPGTGKTRLIVSMITQLIFGCELDKELKILVLAPSNAAVDIIARRLLDVRDRMKARKDKQKKLSLVRYGVMASMHPDVKRIAPENLLQKLRLDSTPKDAHLEHLISTRDRLAKSIEEDRRNAGARATSLGDRIDDMEKRLRQTNETIAKRMAVLSSTMGIKDVLQKVRVVCSTVSSAINLKQFVRQFDVCFLDEASQCTEAWSLVPLQYNISSYILVGDSKQLSPVVLSSICRTNNMERSLFTRLYQGFGETGQISNAISITKQYRMHPEICSFPNMYFYDNRLQSIQTEHASNFLLMPYTLFSLDCKQCNTDAVNFYNTYEARFLLNMLKVMIKHASPKDYSYGIITPYGAQTKTIKRLLGSSSTLSQFDFPVNTIDSYQGQEKDIIILATTRTSGVGFLANSPRLNVAMTRARKSLVICGNFKSFSNVRVWKTLLEDANGRDKIRNVPREYDFDFIAKCLVKPSNKPKTPTE